MSAEKLEEQTRRLAADFLGRELRRLESVEDVVQALPDSEVFLIFAEHQVVAIEATVDRVTFFNPSASEHPPGTPLSGDGLPDRRVEEEAGEESIPLQSLASWMADGKVRALCLA